MKTKLIQLGLLTVLLLAPPAVMPTSITQTAAVLTTLHSFQSSVNGKYLEAGLVQSSDGSFYGTTSQGGKGNGTVFKISTNGALTSLYSFTGGNDVGSPGGLVQGNDGSFYGTTSQGGSGSAGTVFRLAIVPEFQAATLTNGKLNLTWSIEAGGTYQLQFNTQVSRIKS